MSYTQEQYERLCGMISKGVTSLKLGNGEEVTYRSLDEMLRIKRLMEAELKPRGPSRQHYPTFRKG